MESPMGRLLWSSSSFLMTANLNSIAGHGVRELAALAADLHERDEALQVTVGPT